MPTICNDKTEKTEKIEKIATQPKNDIEKNQVLVESDKNNFGLQIQPDSVDFSFDEKTTDCADLSTDNVALTTGLPVDKTNEMVNDMSLQDDEIEDQEKFKAPKIIPQREQETAKSMVDDHGQQKDQNTDTEEEISRTFLHGGRPSKMLGNDMERLFYYANNPKVVASVYQRLKHRLPNSQLKSHGPLNHLEIGSALNPEAQNETDKLKELYNKLDKTKISNLRSQPCVYARSLFDVVIELHLPTTSRKISNNSKNNQFNCSSSVSSSNTNSSTTSNNYNYNQKPAKVQIYCCSAVLYKLAVFRDLILESRFKNFVSNPELRSIQNASGGYPNGSPSTLSNGMISDSNSVIPPNFQQQSSSVSMNDQHHANQQENQESPIPSKNLPQIHIENQPPCTTSSFSHYTTIKLPDQFAHKKILPMVKRFFYWLHGGSLDLSFEQTGVGKKERKEFKKAYLDQQKSQLAQAENLKGLFALMSYFGANDLILSSERRDLCKKIGYAGWLRSLNSKDDLSNNQDQLLYLTRAECIEFVNKITGSSFPSIDQVILVPTSNFISMATISKTLINTHIMENNNSNNNAKITDNMDNITSNNSNQNNNNNNYYQDKNDPTGRFSSSPFEKITRKNNYHQRKDRSERVSGSHTRGHSRENSRTRGILINNGSQNPMHFNSQNFGNNNNFQDPPRIVSSSNRNNNNWANVIVPQPTPILRPPAAHQMLQPGMLQPAFVNIFRPPLGMISGANMNNNNNNNNNRTQQAIIPSSAPAAHISSMSSLDNDQNQNQNNFGRNDLYVHENLNPELDVQNNNFNNIETAVTEPNNDTINNKTDNNNHSSTVPNGPQRPFSTTNLRSQNINNNNFIPANVNANANSWTSAWVNNPIDPDTNCLVGNAFMLANPTPAYVGLNGPPPIDNFTAIKRSQLLKTKRKRNNELRSRTPRVNDGFQNRKSSVRNHQQSMPDNFQPYHNADNFPIISGNHNNNNNNPVRRMMMRPNAKFIGQKANEKSSSNPIITSNNSYVPISKKPTFKNWRENARSNTGHSALQRIPQEIIPSNNDNNNNNNKINSKNGMNNDGMDPSRDSPERWQSQLNEFNNHEDLIDHDYIEGQEDFDVNANVPQKLVQQQHHQNKIIPSNNNVIVPENVQLDKNNNNISNNNNNFSKNNLRTPEPQTSNNNFSANNYASNHTNGQSPNNHPAGWSALSIQQERQQQQQQVLNLGRPVGWTERPRW